MTEQSKLHATDEDRARGLVTRAKKRIAWAGLTLRDKWADESFMREQGCDRRQLPVEDFVINTVLDDLSAAIGYTATQRIAVWFGDTNLYIPKVVEDTPLARLLGEPAYRRLIDSFAEQTLCIPFGTGSRDHMQRQIAELTVAGVTAQSVAEVLNISSRRVEQIIRRLRDQKLLGLVARRGRGNTGLGNARKNRRQKPPGENAPAEIVLENNADKMTLEK